MGLEPNKILFEREVFGVKPTQACRCGPTKSSAARAPGINSPNILDPYIFGTLCDGLVCFRTSFLGKNNLQVFATQGADRNSSCELCTLLETNISRPWKLGGWKMIISFWGQFCLFSGARLLLVSGRVIPKLVGCFLRLEWRFKQNSETLESIYYSCRVNKL